MHGRLVDRLGQHSQTHKQAALAKAVAALLKSRLESQQLEPQHNILSLVYWLAQRPLESPWIPDHDSVEGDAGVAFVFNLHDTSCMYLMLHQLPSHIHLQTV